MILKKIKPRFVAGPPGTGKTHGFIVDLYKKLLIKYHPDNIIILSHTNVAADQIRAAILNIPQIKSKGFTDKSMKLKICTIHKYCKSKHLHKKKFEYEDHKNLILQNRLFAKDPTTNIDKHALYQFRSDAAGRGLSLDQYWRICNTQNYLPYSLSMIKELLPIYKKYKEEPGLEKCDFTDMIENFLKDEVKFPDIDAIIIDECQDSNVPQRKAIEKMAANVKEGHYYLVGDADQTLFEYSGSDADYFHKLAADPWHELKEGKRCSRAINTICKKIIAPIWDKYKSHRVWTPAKYTERHGMGHIGEVIEGNNYFLPNLLGSSNLEILLEKIKNTNQTFLFTFRGTPGDIRCIKFFNDHGLRYSHVSNSDHVSKKEINAHYLWPSFLQGKLMSLTQIKHFWEYAGSIVIPRGKGEYTFEDWIKKDYSVDELINKGLLKSDCKKHKDFDLVRIPSKVTREKLLYIKKIISKGFDYDQKTQIFYGNIHQVKGLTFDNVIVDRTLTRREDGYTQLRLAYTAYSRGIFDCWTLQSTRQRSLGQR